MKLYKFKWYKFKQVFKWKRKGHSNKRTLPITVQDIQKANSKYFATGNDIIKVISIETQTRARFPITDREPSDNRKKTLSYQTSSLYLSDVLRHNADLISSHLFKYNTDIYSTDILRYNSDDYSTDVLKPSTNIYQTKENSRYLLQTINNLLQETENIYNEICPATEIDLFDNLSIQLEPTIWEDDSNDMVSNFNPELFEQIIINTTDSTYDYLDEFLEIYVKAKQEVPHNNSSLQTYKGFSGSTSVLTT